MRDFLEIIGVKELPGGTRGFTTVAGLVLARMDRIPSPGDSVQVGDFRIEVADLDGMRIDKLIVSRQPPPRLSAPPRFFPAARPAAFFPCGVRVACARCPASNASRPHSIAASWLSKNSGGAR